MQQYSYRATDRLGNTIDGFIKAVDYNAAIIEIQRLGFTPIGVQVSGAIAAPQPVAVAAGRNNGPVDLTLPVTQMPAAAADIILQRDPEPLPDPTLALTSTDVGLAAYASAAEQTVSLPTSSAEDTTTRMSRLEPWERVAPVAAGGSGEITTAMKPGGPEMPRHRNQIIRGLERIQFGANSSREVALPQRINETLILPLFSGVKLKELAQWYRQLATLIGAGLNFHQSLVALADNTKNPRLKEIAENGVKQVRAGGYFSDVMAAYPWIFPPMHLEMLRAAEHGGLLEDTLKNIGDYVEHEMEVRSLISRETLYPKLTLVALVFIMGRSGIFGGMPAISALVLGAPLKTYLMDTIGFACMILIPILALVAFCRLFAFNSSYVRSLYDEAKISIPVVGRIVRNFAIAKFARTYSALSHAGFASSSALQISGDASGNVVIARAAQHAALKAESGGLPSQALRETKQFTQMAVDMLQTAEVSGSVDAMMDKVADYHELEAKSACRTACIVFSVFVFFVVAVLVAMSVIGFYTGYANMVKSAGGS